jgi:thiamine biosynthesis protein ThiI
VITGEAIGQVSSQTLANLAALEGASDVPVFRPLLGFDKSDIVDLSNRIGTYEISSRVREYCAIAPGNPVTNATLRATQEEESHVDLSVVHAAASARRVLHLHEINSADLAASYLFTETIPGDAVVLDVRDEPAWSAWHYPGAERRDFWELEQNLSALDRDRTYVLYCDAGTQAAFLAERLQQKGIEAYAYRGGTRALRARAGEPAS